MLPKVMQQAIVLLAMSLTACGGSAPEEKAASDARVIELLDPQPILFPDIQSASLYGPGCAFAPEGGGMAAIVMTQGQRAAIKLKDGLVMLAPDLGSTAMPRGTWSRYAGKTHALTLTRIDAKAGDTAWHGKLVITDANDQIVYETTGLAQCKG